MITRSIDTGNRSDQGIEPMSIGDCTLYILVIGAGAPARLKLIFAYHYSGPCQVACRPSIKKCHSLGTKQQKELQAKSK